MTKRSEFATYINTTPSTTATYKLLGEGILDSSINYNPQTSEKVYIHQDSGTTDIESYKPTMPVEAEHIESDDALEYLDGLRKARAVLDAAQTDVVNVWLYETPTAGAYPAEKQAVSIQFDTYGGAGGEIAKMSFTILYRGDPTAGTFNPTTGTFTAS